jgi:hypothetical protein
VIGSTMGRIFTLWRGTNGANEFYVSLSCPWRFLFARLLFGGLR